MTQTVSFPLKPSPTLDHLCRFLNSVRGTDKVLMFIQYFAKILIWHANKRSPTGSAELSKKLTNLASPIGDFRVLLRYYGLVPMLQWIVHLENHPPKSKYILMLSRLENLFNVCYYPLEHVYWLSSHNVIDIKPETRDKIGLWSCRFWAAYVTVYFLHLYQDYQDLRKEEIKLLKDGGATGNDPELKNLQHRKQTLLANTLVNAAYFPLTIHWSLPNGIRGFPDIGVGVLGLVASLGQLWTAWKASA